MEKQRGLIGKKYFIGILLLLFIFSIGLISAAQTVTIISPINWGNYSTTLNVSVTTSDALNTSASNVTFYCNKSGGSVAARTGADIYKVVTMTPKDATNKLFENATVNISLYTEAMKLYNCSAYADNNTAQVWSAVAKNITIDNTPPNVTTFYTVENNGNYSGIINLNITVDDALIGVSSVYFNITNSTGQVSFTRANNLNGGIYYNLTINTVDYLDGKYNITVYANDTLNNLNITERIQGTVDNTPPIPSLTCSSLTPTRGDVVTCICSGTDATSGVSSGAGSSTLSTSETGTFTEGCTIIDYAGNSATVSVDYVVGLDSSGSNLRGGGGGSIVSKWVKEIKLNDSALNLGQTLKELKKNYRITFNVTGMGHSVGITNITLTAVTIEVASTPQSATMVAGETKKFDVNEDGYYDLSVFVSSITYPSANLVLESINEKIITTTSEDDTTPEAALTAGEEQQAGMVLGMSYWIWIIIAIIILAVLFGWKFLFNSKKKRK